VQRGNVDTLGALVLAAIVFESSWNFESSPDQNSSTQSALDGARLCDIGNNMKPNKLMLPDATPILRF